MPSSACSTKLRTESSHGGFNKFISASEAQLLKYRRHPKLSPPPQTIKRLNPFHINGLHGFRIVIYSLRLDESYHKNTEDVISSHNGKAFADHHVQRGAEVISCNLYVKKRHTQEKIRLKICDNRHN